MTMQKWIEATDDLIRFRKKDLLKNSGNISHKKAIEKAIEKANKEYKKFRIIKDV